MCPESQVSFEGPGVEHNASLKLKLQELQSQVDRLTSRRVLELPTDLGIYDAWRPFQTGGSYLYKRIGMLLALGYFGSDHAPSYRCSSKRHETALYCRGELRPRLAQAEL